ncbi:NUDIX hydrolase [Bacillus taeanensis]|uniref:ADP-ribose pyrophosphatase n=1 Tax=Bacillus taeanensis TaxID=273032 RepID=A0A366Y0R4_9BACI|nr:NUDIX hydrolase [Bacillus taeanensis]RBW69994.1 ADP-ribose pyrophosphatase [Bacillus taeanensis]
MGFPKHKTAAAVAVLNDHNKLLLVKGYVRGWEFPGGYVEIGEPIEKAAVREVKEESGIEVEITKFCGVYQDLKSSTFVYLFTAKAVGGKLRDSSETLASGFFSVEEALQKVTWKNHNERILRCLNEEEHPFLISF